jgi:hypothetical protein
MSAVAFFQARYLASQKTPFKGKKTEINSTKKWAEHRLNLWEMKQLLDHEELTYDERVALRRASEVAERKCAWHYRRDDFDLKVASFLLETAKRAMPELN